MTLLLEGKAEAEQATIDGVVSLSQERIAYYQEHYESIITEGEIENPRNAVSVGGQRGRVKQTPAYNLLLRLRNHQDDTLRYLTDLRVPFDNNLAERDVRMPKCKQKISGCFRTDEGADTFAIIRSYLSSLRKQSENIFDALVDTCTGKPPMPALGGG
jgi:transposase